MKDLLRDVAEALEAEGYILDGVDGLLARVYDAINESKPVPKEQLGFSFSKFGTPGCASQCSTFTVGVPVALPVTVYACSCGTVKCGRCS